MPGLLLGLVDIFFLPGRVGIERLSWTDRLLVKVGAMMEKDPLKKKALRSDMDGVKRENIAALVNAIRTYTPVVGESTCLMAESGIS